MKREDEGVTCSVPDEFLILLSMVFCLKNCHMWKNKEIFMWPSWCLTCVLMLTIFQVTGGSSNHPRLVPKWLREILIFWVTRYSLSNMLKMIHWCGDIAYSNFTDDLHDEWWVVSFTLVVTRFAVFQACLHISIKTSKNGLKVDIYFFRVLSWLCALKNGNFRCSNLVSCLWNTVLSSISVCYIERPLTLKCKWISNKTFLNMTRDV